MAEYIERDALVRQIICNMAEFVGAPDAVLRHDEKCDYAILCLESAPAADVAPVVHGRWSDAGFGELPKHAPYGWACSVCGGISFNNEYIHCPNCGARMDGGANNG